MPDIDPMQKQPSGHSAASLEAVPATLYDLIRIVLVDPELQCEQKKKLIDELRKANPSTDRWTFRWAIWILGIVVILSVIALWALQGNGYDSPDGLVAIGSGAVGGLAGLLASGRDRDNHG